MVVPEWLRDWLICYSAQVFEHPVAARRHQHITPTVPMLTSSLAEAIAIQATYAPDQEQETLELISPLALFG